MSPFPIIPPQQPQEEVPPPQEAAPAPGATIADTLKQYAEQKALQQDAARGLSQARVDWFRNQAMMPIEYLDRSREQADMDFEGYWGTLSPQERDLLAPVRQVYYDRRKVLDQLDLSPEESFAVSRVMLVLQDPKLQALVSEGVSPILSRLMEPTLNALQFIGEQTGLREETPASDTYQDLLSQFAFKMNGDLRFTGDEQMLRLYPHLLSAGGEEIPEELRKDPSLLPPFLAMAVAKGREREKLGLASNVPPEVSGYFQNAFEEQGGLGGDVAGLLGFLIPASWAAKGAGAASTLLTGGRSALPLLSSAAGFGLAEAATQKDWEKFVPGAAFGAGAHLAGRAIGGLTRGRQGAIARGLRGEQGLAAYPGRVLRETGALTAGGVAADVVEGRVPEQDLATNALVASLFGLRGRPPEGRGFQPPRGPRGPTPPRAPRPTPPQPPRVEGPRAPRVRAPEGPRVPRVRGPEAPRGPRGPEAPRGPRGPSPPRVRGPRTPRPEGPKRESGAIRRRYEVLVRERPIEVPFGKPVEAPRPEPRPEARPEERPVETPRQRPPLAEWSYPDLQREAKKRGLPATAPKERLVSSIRLHERKKWDSLYRDIASWRLGKPLHEIHPKEVNRWIEEQGLELSVHAGWRLMDAHRRAVLAARRAGVEVDSDLLSLHGIKPKISPERRAALDRLLKEQEERRRTMRGRELTEADKARRKPSEWEPVSGSDVMERRFLRGKGASKLIEAGRQYRIRNPLYGRKKGEPHYITVKTTRKLSPQRWEAINLKTNRKVKVSIRRIYDEVRMREKPKEPTKPEPAGSEGWLSGTGEGELRYALPSGEKGGFAINRPVAPHGQVRVTEFRGGKRVRDHLLPEGSRRARVLEILREAKKRGAKLSPSKFFMERLGLTKEDLRGLSPKSESNLREVVESAPKVFEGGRQGKRYISDVWREYQKRTGEDISLRDFQKRLWEEHAKGEKGAVRLSRADLVEAMDAAKIKESRMSGPAGGEFHLVEARKPPAKREYGDLAAGFLDLGAVAKVVSTGAKMPARMISGVADFVISKLGQAARSFSNVLRFLRSEFGPKVARYARDIYDATIGRLTSKARGQRPSSGQEYVQRTKDPKLPPGSQKKLEPAYDAAMERNHTSVVDTFRGMYKWIGERLSSGSGEVGMELRQKTEEAARVRLQFEGMMWEKGPKGPDLGGALRWFGRPFTSLRMMGPARKDGDVAFSRFHDIASGNIGPTNRLEHSANEHARRLFDRTWQMMRELGWTRWNHRLGVEEPLPPKPTGGRILPWKHSPEFYEAVREFDTHHLFARKFAREVSRVNRQGGHEWVTEKYLLRWWERFREQVDVTYMKPGQKIKQVNAEFMREIPIMPSFMAWGRVAGRWRRWFPILEPNPYYYIRSYANQVSARAGFLASFGKDFQPRTWREEFSKAGGDPLRFDQAMRAVQELPIYISPINSRTNWLLRPGIHAYQAIQSLYRTLMLSRASIAVGAETLAGPTTMFFGVTPQVKALGWRASRAIGRMLKKDVKGSVAALNAMGTGFDMVPNYSINPREFGSSLSRMLSDFLQRNIFFFTRASVAQERHIGMTAVQFMKTLQGQAGPRPKWMKPFDLFRRVFNVDMTALRTLGFTREEAMRIRKGDMSMKEFQRAVQNASAAITGGRRPSVHDSLFGKNPWSRFLFFFTDYARTRLRQGAKVGKSWWDAKEIVESNQYTKAEKLDALRNAAMTTGRFLGFSTLQGFSYMFAIAALKGGPGDEKTGAWPGVDILFNEIGDAPFKHLLLANFYSGILGPFASLGYLYGTQDPIRDTIRITGPGSVAVEVYEFSAGTGLYREKTPLERAATLLQKRMPLGPLATTWGAAIGLGSKNAALEAAWSARWRYMYSEDLIKEGYMGSRGQRADEAHLQFRKKMRAAEDALRAEDYERASRLLADAAGYKPGSPGRSVASSLLFKRALWNFNEELSPEQKEGLRKRIGDRAYLMLEQYDAILEAWASVFAGL